MSSSRLSVLAAPSLLVALALAAVGPRAEAQCFGPDGLDLGNCCQPVTENLPPFPAIAIPGMGICWNACALAGTQDVRVDWTLPRLASCGQYDTLLTVTDAFGSPIVQGKLQMDYTRTWEETDVSGLNHQVWRFAVKADLFLLATGTPPCMVPTCITPSGAQPTAFYYGYVDYMSCSSADPWEAVLVLHHACDRFIHQPGLSDRPGTFHPGSSYGIVAPHSPVQVFTPLNLVAPGGPLIGEAARNIDVSAPPPVACVVEDPVVAGAMSPLGAGCVCTLSTFPKQQTLRKFSGTNSCVNAIGVPGGWVSLDIAFPTLPWKHMVTTSIGRWSSPFSYPGQEAAWVDEGLFVHQDPCRGDFLEMKYGGSTRGGWTPTLPTPIGTADNFTDLASNYTAPLFGPYPSPILGTIRNTEHLIYVNEP